MQVSFSETFNIVGADIVSQGVPLVSSEEVLWKKKDYAIPTSLTSICTELLKAYSSPEIAASNAQTDLIKYVDETESVWINYLKF